MTSDDSTPAPPAEPRWGPLRSCAASALLLTAVIACAGLLIFCWIRLADLNCQVTGNTCPPGP